MGGLIWWLYCFGNLALASDECGSLQVAVLVGCALCQMSDVVFVGRECLLLCGVSDDRCIGFNFAGWLSGGCMVGLLAVLLSLAMPGLCRFLRVTPCMHGCEVE